MAAPAEKFPDVAKTTRQKGRDDIKRVLNTFDGPKDLVLDPDLMKPLDRVAGAAFLKGVVQIEFGGDQTNKFDNGVDKIFILDKTARTAPASSCGRRVFFVKPKITVMKILADQMLHEQSKGVNRKYKIVMIPRKLYLCEMILEQEGVYGLCEMDELPLDLIPLDTDILSMEMPDFFRAFYLDGDQTWLHTVSRSVKMLESDMGVIPNIYCLGKASKMCCELLNHLRGDRLQEPDYSRSQIGHLFFIDRDVDFVTPLCSQVTYEGLLDDIFGISCGYVEFGSEVTGKNASAKLLLSSEDPMFEEIRNRHFTNVFEFLKAKAQDLQATSDKRNNFKSVSDMKDFVAKDLRQLNQTKANLSYHIGACEQIIQKKNKGDFEEYIMTEHSLLEGTGTKENINYIEEAIHKQNNLINNLKLMCLMSQTGDGIIAKDYKSLKTQFVQSHGFEQMLTFYNLKKVGLLREQDTGSQSSKPLPMMAAGMAALTRTSSFKILRKKLNLIPAEDVDLKSPCNMSYVFSGAYAPMSCKLVEQCLNREGFVGMDDIVKNISGGVHSDVRLKTPGKGVKGGTVKMGPRPAKVVLVYFLGGCTYSEITALRFLGRQTGYRFLVATSSIFTGSSLIETVMEKPQV